MDILHHLFAQYREYAAWQIAMEAIATFFGITSVYFSIKKHIWVYPTGIISTALYIYLMMQAGLIGDTLINFYYTVMSIYGWILWNRNKSDEVHVIPERMNRPDVIKTIALMGFSVLLVLLIYQFLPFYGIAENTAGISNMDWANWMDVVTTSIFLGGMWLMAGRKIENWLFWIVGDFISIPMMIYKGLTITSVQYLVFTIMAIGGYIAWSTTLKSKIL